MRICSLIYEQSIINGDAHQSGTAVFFLPYIENAAHTDSIEELRNIVAFCLHFSQSYLIHEGIKSPQSLF